MAVPLQHQLHNRPTPTVAELHAMMMEMRAVLFALAHEIAQDGTGGPDTCLRAVLARVAPMPVQPVVGQTQ